MALLVSVIASEELGVLLRGHGGEGKGRPQLSSKVVSESETAAGVGGPQKAFIMEGCWLQDCSQLAVPVGDAGIFV